MAYEKETKPYPPVISGVSAIWDNELEYNTVPGVLFRVNLEDYSGDELDDGETDYYEAVLADSEQTAKDISYFESDNILEADDTPNVPLHITKGFTNVANEYISGFESDAYLNMQNISTYPMWFGKDLYIGARRILPTTAIPSDITTRKFYFPHLDEPLYTLSQITPDVIVEPDYKPLTERVLTRIWTCSETFINGAPYNNNDSFKSGDVFIYFNSVDNVFHKVCFVISFYDHAAYKVGSGASPYNTNSLPVYFSTDPASAYLYNPELVGSLFVDDDNGSPNLSALLDNYTVIPYTFPTVGKQYVGLIGNITLTNTFDGMRFRINNLSSLYYYDMYLHIFIDGHYANPESVLLGRGYPATYPTIVNGFMVGDTVVKLSTKLDSSITETAVKLSCSANSPKYWSAIPSTKYSKGCPTEEFKTC